MADETQTTPAGAEQQQPTIEGGAYEIIRARLLEQSDQLSKLALELNQRRVEVFGGTEMKVLGNERIRTEHNCVPRDIAEIGGQLLFGYNVHLGLKKEIELHDVFSVHTFKEVEEGFAFEEVPLEQVSWLNHDKVRSDFTDIYKYYKDAFLSQLRIINSRLLAVFQIGESVHDIKVMRWALQSDGSVVYIDNRGDEDHVFPPSHDFEWTATGRDDFVFGQHPHVNILDKVFVEAVGGDLTVKVEDNTSDGQGIYRELVEDKDQTLDDGEIHYAELGALILLKIKPYREEVYRYLVFNTRSREVRRIDAIGSACVQLPENHGVVFPGGYYLQDGETKTFDLDTEGLEFKNVIRSPNGEDVMYAFYQRVEGRHVLLSYNLIRKEVESPIICNGYCQYDDGKMIVFRADPEPSRVHMMRVWQTSYMSEEVAAQTSAESEHAGSMLVKVGNAELVRGISDCNSLRRTLQNQEPSMQVYEDLIGQARRVVDAYPWLGEAELGGLGEVLSEVLKNAELILDEFEKVISIQRQAADSLRQAAEAQEELLNAIQPDLWRTVDHFVEAMAKLRGQRGQLITLREMRYMDLARVDELETAVAEQFEMLSGRAVEFLLGDEALKPYHDKYDEIMAEIETMPQARHAVPLAEQLDLTAVGLDLLSEVVSGLKIDDATARTRILEEIGEVFALVNRARATLEGKRKELLSTEGVAEFGAQFKLFSQSVQSALAVCDTPEKCDDQLSKLMVQLEELEGRFADFDQFLGDLAQKREEVYEALNGRKQTLLEARQRRAQNLQSAADRILQGVSRRALTFKDISDLNAYFASDAMVLKVRDIAAQLMELGEAVKADELVARIKATRDTSSRQIKDKAELFAEGDNIIKLGKHHFTVNTQTLDLTMLPHGDGMGLHLSGTDYMEGIVDEQLEAMRDYWDQTLVSETKEVYRAEYLAACMLFDADAGREGLSLETLRATVAAEEGALLSLVRKYAASRYDEGYDRGVHDADAALILEKMLGLYQAAGLLRFAPVPRALACLFWGFCDDQAKKALLQRKAQSLGRLRDTFATSPAHEVFAAELAREIGLFLEAVEIAHHAEDLRIGGAYLAQELAADQPRFSTSTEAATLRDAFLQQLDDRQNRPAFDEDQRSLGDDLATRYQLTTAWLDAFVTNTDRPEIQELRPVLEEAVALILTESNVDRDVGGGMSSVEVEGILGQHPQVENRRMRLRLDEFLSRLSSFRNVRVPGYQAFRALRHDLLDRAKASLRLDEFKPRVLTSFVRNKLINDVYLSLIGDNLAKQIGAAGDQKRTDLMGLLLLISPPGYGKTTLMEYVANRLGVVFMKVNGPSLGHSVISFDPTEAPNATARQEVNKINLAFEMGNNVMLYLDDIQHTNPELLQKFISLCDASRRVEGVWNGRTRTYDMRGKKFCVVMAGNPYTEAGEKFQIPDMLANRADIYNLGDILGGKEEIFALSYIENALTSNAALQPLATRELADLYLLVRMAKGEEIPASDLSYTYSAVEIEEIVSVLQKMFRAQEVVLKVNAAYIASAATDEKFRTEPRFQLQGSYRNMNKLAEKIVAVMNAEELEQLIDDHYQGEAQTLTSGAEANLLKLRELRGTLSAEDQERWTEILKTYGRNQMMGGDADDPVARVTSTLGGIAQRIEEVQEALAAAATRSAEIAERSAQAADVRSQAFVEPMLGQLDGLKQAIAKAVQLQVKHSGASATASAEKLGAELVGLRETITQVAKATAAQSSKQGTAQVEKLGAELGGLRETIGQATQALAAQSNKLGVEQTKQVRAELGGLRAAITQATKSLATQAQEQAELAGERGANQLQNLLAELGHLRETIVWATQTGYQGEQGRAKSERKGLSEGFGQISETIAEAAKQGLRMQAHVAQTGQAGQQALLQHLERVVHNLGAVMQQQRAAAVAEGGAGVAGSDDGALTDLVQYQGKVIEGTLIPLVKAVARGMGSGRGTAALDKASSEKLDEALVLLRELEGKVQSRRYGPVGTRREK